MNQRPSPSKATRPQQKNGKLLRTNDALRAQIFAGVNQISSEHRLRRIAQRVSQEWLAEQGGDLIMKGAAES